MFFFFFQKDFSWVRRGGFHPFPKKVFFKGLGDFFGMGINQKGCFLGGMGARSLVVFRSMKMGFF
jgi:hypothetical protein